MTAMSRILFGDNQFFGVNHMSEEKGRASLMRFQDLSEIIAVIDMAYDAGVRTFMCTTHDRIAEVCEHVRRNPGRYAGMQFYPCMPYAHKYANAMTEHGVVEAVRMFLPTDGAISGLVKGGISAARKDLEGMSQLLIDAEMKMFEGLSTPVIFMLNILTDLLLGLGAIDGFRIFAEHVRNRYGAEPGFITMNLPRALDALEAVGIDNPIVCASINKAGFRMAGGKHACEQAIATRRFRPVAMGVLASGGISAREALEYITSQRKIESILFGASSAANIRQTKQLIDEFDGRFATV